MEPVGKTFISLFDNPGNSADRLLISGRAAESRDEGSSLVGGRKCNSLVTSFVNIRPLENTQVVSERAYPAEELNTKV